MQKYLWEDLFKNGKVRFRNDENYIFTCPDRCGSIKQDTESFSRDLKNYIKNNGLIHELYEIQSWQQIDIPTLFSRPYILFISYKYFNLYEQYCENIILNKIIDLQIKMQEDGKALSRTNIFAYVNRLNQDALNKGLTMRRKWNLEFTLINQVF